MCSFSSQKSRNLELFIETNVISPESGLGNVYSFNSRSSRLEFWISHCQLSCHHAQLGIVRTYVVLYCFVPPVCGVPSAPSLWLRSLSNVLRKWALVTVHSFAQLHVARQSQAALGCTEQFKLAIHIWYEFDIQLDLYLYSVSLPMHTCAGYEYLQWQQPSELELPDYFWYLLLYPTLNSIHMPIVLQHVVASVRRVIFKYRIRRKDHIRM